MNDNDNDNNDDNNDNVLLSLLGTFFALKLFSGLFLEMTQIIVIVKVQFVHETHNHNAQGQMETS